MRTPFSVHCSACNHPPRDHHRDSCDGRYLHPLRLSASNCRCTNPLGLHKHSLRLAAWRDITISASTVEAIGMNSLVMTVFLAMIWYLEVF